MIKSILGSEPTVWDGDLDKSVVLRRFHLVPSPPCGMETYLWWFLTRYLRTCSEPTVWDGDIPVAIFLPPLGKVFRAHRVGWRRSRFERPPRIYPVVKFRAHRVGWRHGFPTNSEKRNNSSEPTVWDGDTAFQQTPKKETTVPSPPCGMETQQDKQLLIYLK